jgi:Domain of unknown function (DUF4124)
MVSNPHTLARALALVGLTLLSAGSVSAQWQWIDGTGSRVFSDTPPPAGTLDKNILKRPGGARPTTAQSAPSGTTSISTADAAAAKPSGKDSELEARKKQAQEAEQAKKKVQLEKFTKARAENCERAKRAQNTVSSGVRIATTNAKGETEFLDDKARAVEARRIDELVKSECSPLPQAAQ